MLVSLPGVEVVADFEKDMVEKEIMCYLADGTVKNAPISGELINFTKKNLGRRDSYSWSKWFSLNPPLMRLDTWINKSSHEGDLILQMDIEGHEYRVLDSISDEILKKFRIITAEFHDLRALTNYYSKYYYYKQYKANLMYKAFKRLSEHFYIVHIHPNNFSKLFSCGNYTVPDMLEITFLRKDRVHSSKPAIEFPHPLDQKNVSWKPAVDLPKCWYE